jgi:hypothetical protein
LACEEDGQWQGWNMSHYTPEEEENVLVRRYYAGDSTRNEVLATGRSLDSIKQRAKNLGLKWVPRRPSWEPIDDD